MRDFAQQAETAETGANIINIIDQRVWRLTPDFSSYTVSKAGLWTLTQTAAQALAPRDIRVNALAGSTLPNPRQDQAEFDKQTASYRSVMAQTLTTLSRGALYLVGRGNDRTNDCVGWRTTFGLETPDVTQVKE